MEKGLFPKEFIKSSLEHYTFQLRKRSQAIYVLVLAFVIVLLASLPLITLKVSKSATGLITTSSNKFQITSPISGVILSHKIHENERVAKGDTLLTFDVITAKKEVAEVTIRLEELRLLADDLEHLLSNESDQILSEKYLLEWAEYQSYLKKMDLERTRTERVYRRQKQLFDQRVIAAADFERDEANFRQASAEKELYIRQSRNRWKEKALALEQELKDLSLTRQKLLEELKKSHLVAPCTGEILQSKAIIANQFIAAGTQLAEITPDSTLLAICYVSPRDIGSLSVGMHGSFEIEAFNPNQWGSLSGQIQNISTDAYLINDQPFFRIECRLNKNFLQLQNGFVGKLRKGMTIRAHFLLAERTLFQLLHDKLDDWLNPKRIK